MSLYLGEVADAAVNLRAARLTLEKAIRDAYERGETNEAIGMSAGVSDDAIRMFAKRKGWKR